MPRPKGSKNKTEIEKIVDIIEEVKELDISVSDKEEIIDELDDLLEIKQTSGRLVGYHPVTGVEIWN